MPRLKLTARQLNRQWKKLKALENEIFAALRERKNLDKRIRKMQKEYLHLAQPFRPRREVCDDPMDPVHGTHTIYLGCD